jgi:hypothetical protein
VTNQFSVGDKIPSYLSVDQQTQLEFFAGGWEENVAEVVSADVEHWRFGSELVTARELRAGMFLVVPAKLWGWANCEFGVCVQEESVGVGCVQCGF